MAARTRRSSPPRRATGLIASPRFASGAAIAIAVLVGGAILAASAPGQFPGFGRSWTTITGSWRRSRSSHAWLRQGHSARRPARPGPRPDHRRSHRSPGSRRGPGGGDPGADQSSARSPTGIAAFFIADATVACALLGRRLMASPRMGEGRSEQTRTPSPTTVEAGAFIPFDAVVVAGRSEVNDGPIGGSLQGSLREVGDVVRRGARNGDRRLTIEPWSSRRCCAPAIRRHRTSPRASMHGRRYCLPG